MSQHDFRRLVNAICQDRELPRDTVEDDLFHLRIDDVGCTLMVDTVVEREDAVAFFVDYGQPPESLRGEVLQELMETNLFMSGPFNPRFGCNPENGHVVYTGHAPIAGLEAGPLLQVLEQAAQQALQWNASLLIRMTPALAMGSATAAFGARSTQANLTRHSRNLGVKP